MSEDTIKKKPADRIWPSQGLAGKEYAEAGVDIDAAASTVKIIKEMAKKTHNSDVISGIGGFSGLFRLPQRDDQSRNVKSLVLAAGADGVGTKVKIAQMLGKHDTVGIDLVAMNVDDIVTAGASPLFFLDYIAIGKIDPKIVEDIVKGIADGCQMANCVLLGGETAQMPDMYKAGEYDLAGFCVGAVEEEKIIDGRSIVPGDVMIGLSSSGLHSNGYSLVRKVLLEKAKLKLESYIHELGGVLGEVLLTPTRIYAPFVLDAAKSMNIKGLAHITGGGIVENVPRILPPGVEMEVSYNWPVPPIFQLIQKLGSISDDEMRRVFNLGVGMVVIVSPKEAQVLLNKARKANIQAFEVGEIVERA